MIGHDNAGRGEEWENIALSRLHFRVLFRDVREKLMARESRDKLWMDNGVKELNCS